MIEFTITLSTGRTVNVYAEGKVFDGETHFSAGIPGSRYDEPRWTKVETLEIFDEEGNEILLTEKEREESEQEAAERLVDSNV